MALKVLDQKISEHFTLNEFVRSSVAKKFNIDNSSYMTIGNCRNLQQLCNTILEPIRNSIKSPLIINSGFRCELLNKIVGGVSTSKHLFGKAADIRSVSLTITQLARVIYELRDKGVIKPSELIIHESYIHIAL